MVWPWQRHRDSRRLKGPNRAELGSRDPEIADVHDIDADRRSAGFEGRIVGKLRPIPSGRDCARSWPAQSVSGWNLDRERADVSFSGRGLVLLCFLATRCDGCEVFWEGLRDDSRTDLPAGIRRVIITREEPSANRGEVVRLARGAERWPVIMSDEAWQVFEVYGYPFFVLIDAERKSVIGETTAFEWSDVGEMVTTATAG